MRMKARPLISKMASLAEQIKNLSCPEPTNFDPEEDDFDTTRATLVNKDNHDNVEGDSFDSSVLRNKNVSLLADEDSKYRGRRVSRGEMARMRGDFVDSDESVDELDNGDNSDEVSDDSQKSFDEPEMMDDEEENIDEYIDNHGSEAEDDDDEDDEDDDDDDDDDEDDDEGEGGDMLSNTLGDNDDQGAGISSFSASKMEEEIEKGTAVKHQLSLWDTFLEYRIRLQKAMVLTNKLPQYEVSQSFLASSNGNLKPETLKGKKALSDLLYKLLIIQEKLLDQNSDTTSALYPVANTGVKKSDIDDDEIPSDSEDEEKQDEKIQPDPVNSLKLPLKRKGNFTQEEYCECISKRHAAFQDVRDSIISKWSEKTRLASGKLSSKSFSAFDRSALSQIKQVLSDKQRLIKRSQLKRTSYRVLGKCEKEKSDDAEPEDEANTHLKDYDTEIFDDDDFYHQLLRELIEKRTTSNSDDPIEMGRQWLELQKLRRKIKKKVDTKASKGRKLRYNVLSKLVSYMPPIERGSMPDSSRNELFASLFGQSKARTETCDIDVFR